MPRKERGYAASLRAGRTANRRRLDRQLLGLDERVGPVPAGGWIRKIRDALGMSTMDLAVRLGVTRERVHQFEQAEVRGSIPLSTLQRVAAALNSRVCYVLVPVEPLERMVRRQALARAAWVVAASLSASQARQESQGGQGSEDREQAPLDVVAAQVEAMASELVDRRGLWQVPPRFPPTEPA
jgi:predicted DNA-binding mobile mystery protein A